MVRLGLHCGWMAAEESGWFWGYSLLLSWQGTHWIQASSLSFDMLQMKEVTRDSIRSSLTDDDSGGEV